MSIEEIENIVRKSGSWAVGLDQSKIDRIEENFNVRLPIVYRVFLSIMGKEAGQYMRGSSVFFNEIYLLRDGAEELLKENNFRPLPKDVFVFWMHQGYQFAFFYLNQGNDPAVYYYCEGTKEPDFIKINKTLSEFFEKQMIGTILKK